MVEGSQYHKLSKQPMVVTMLDLKSQFLCMCLLLNYPYHVKGSFKNKFTSLQELYVCRAFRLHRHEMKKEEKWDSLCLLLFVSPI